MESVWAAVVPHAIIATPLLLLHTAEVPTSLIVALCNSLAVAFLLYVNLYEVPQVSVDSSLLIRKTSMIHYMRLLLYGFVSGF